MGLYGAVYAGWEGAGLRLSPRLQMVADAIPPDLSVADIGSDHMELPVYLAALGHTGAIIATEAGRERYYQARLAMERGAANRIDLRFGDGLAVLQPGEAQVLVLAGLGGTTIRDVLAGGEAVARQARLLILQPMVAARKLRYWLLLHGYGLVGEALAQEGSHYYELILASGEQAADQWCIAPAGGAEQLLAVLAPAFHPLDVSGFSFWSLLEVGPVAFRQRHPLLPGFLDHRIAHYHELAEALAAQSSRGAVAKLQHLRRRLVELKRLRTAL